MINVVVASPFIVVREGVKRILAAADDIAILEEVECLSEINCPKKFSAAHVVILSDISAHDGQDRLAMVKNVCPWLRMIVITRTSALSQILTVLRQGARGLLSVTCAASHLPAAIRAVHLGRVYIQESMSQIIARDANGFARDRSHQSLTQREMQIFMRLALGSRVTDIAIELGISVKTVSTHKGRMMEKMGISSFSQLVEYAMANGLLDAPDGLPAHASLNKPC